MISIKHSKTISTVGGEDEARSSNKFKQKNLEKADNNNSANEMSQTSKDDMYADSIKGKRGTPDNIDSNKMKLMNKLGQMFKNPGGNNANNDNNNNSDLHRKLIVKNADIENKSNQSKL